MSKYSRTGLCIFLFFISLYSFFSIGHFGGDGYQDYLTAESIVLDGNLSLFDRPDDVDELDYVKNVGVTGTDGRKYSSRSNLVASVVLVPFYTAGHIASKFISNAPHDYITMLFVSFANPVMLALGCMLLFYISRQLGFSKKISSILSLLLGFSTMAPVYARTGFSEIFAMDFMLAAILFLFRFKASLKTRYLVIGAISAALMFYARAITLIFVPCFFFYLIWAIAGKDYEVSGKVRDVLLFSLVFGVIFVGILCINYFIYGNPFSFGGVNAITIGKRIAQAPHVLKGIYYYLISTGKGFFIYNIPVIFGLFAIPFAIKRNKKETVLFLIIFAVNLLFYVKSFRRGSLFSWGPRYLLLSVPLLILLVGDYIEAFKSALSRILLVLGSIVGLAVILPCMFINQSRFYLFVVEKLGLEEYMINFIPDLSPIKGAWWMFASRIMQYRTGAEPIFTYAPDYRLVEPVSATMDGYNYFDLWFLKVLQISPSFAPLVYSTLFILGAVGVVLLIKVIRSK